MRRVSDDRVCAATFEERRGRAYLYINIYTYVRNSTIIRGGDLFRELFSIEYSSRPPLTDAIPGKTIEPFNDGKWLSTKDGRPAAWRNAKPVRRNDCFAFLLILCPARPRNVHGVDVPTPLFMARGWVTQRGCRSRTKRTRGRKTTITRI